MTWYGGLQILAFAAIIAALTRPVGAYLHRVFEIGPWPRPFDAVERAFYRIAGVDPDTEQSWLEYAGAVLAFGGVGAIITYAILRAQAWLPLNPDGLAGVGPELAFNTAISFVTNTNWQSYAGESTLGHFAQMAGLAWHNFTSAAVGLGVALALARGLTRPGRSDGRATVGNFWVDLVRGVLYVLLPLSIPLALVLTAGGVPQNFASAVHLTTLEGNEQILAMGPVASQEVIKQLGTNGGGFFNANSAHPFENPTPLTNFLATVLIFLLPAGLTYTFGRMARDQRQGWALFAAMAVLFVGGVALTYAAEAGSNPALRGLAVDQSAGNLEGKESRFGVAASALFATATTDASCGAVNAMHDSFTPLGGLVPMINIQLGEVIFGGVGAGLYGMLIFALLTVFVCGLMVGRTPEYLGKKVEEREVKFAMLYTLIFPLLILGFAGWAAVAPYAITSLNNAGPHGLSEILYAFSSAAGNNGSAFAGLNANTTWWNLALGVAMLAGRFLMIVPVLAIAGTMAAKTCVPPSPGTFPTDGALYVALLLAVIVVFGALTFFPALTLGPIVEHLLAGSGRLF